MRIYYISTIAKPAGIKTTFGKTEVDVAIWLQIRASRWLEQSEPSFHLWGFHGFRSVCSLDAISHNQARRWNIQITSFIKYCNSSFSKTNIVTWRPRSTPRPWASAEYYWGGATGTLTVFISAMCEDFWMMQLVVPAAAVASSLWARLVNAMAACSSFQYAPLFPRTPPLGLHLRGDR